MTRRDWWLGIGLLAATLLLQAAIPRYEWQHTGEQFYVRVDRWTGAAQFSVPGALSAQDAARVSAALPK